MPFSRVGTPKNFGLISQFYFLLMLPFLAATSAAVMMMTTGQLDPALIKGRWEYISRAISTIKHTILFQYREWF